MSLTYQTVWLYEVQQMSTDIREYEVIHSNSRKMSSSRLYKTFGNFATIVAPPRCLVISAVNNDIMMASSNGNIFLVTGLWEGNLLDSTHTDKWRGPLMFSVMRAWTNDWANSRDGGDLRRHNAHCDVTVMWGRCTTNLVNIFHRSKCVAIRKQSWQWD